MITVRIEHPIKSYDAWKAAFDRDPADREGSGVRHYVVMRPLDDPAYVLVDLDFATPAEAERFLERMRGVWASAQAAPALGGAPQAKIVQRVEDETLSTTPEPLIS